MRIPEGSKKLSRKQIDDYTGFVSTFGAKGLAYIKVNDATSGQMDLQSPIVKFLGKECMKILCRVVNVKQVIYYFWSRRCCGQPVNEHCAVKLPKI